MSRSYRYSPFCGHTTVESEKKDKRIANRRERRTIRQMLGSDLEDDALPHRNELSNPYHFGKDGKQHLESSLPDFDKLMRK